MKGRGLGLGVFCHYKKIWQEQSIHALFILKVMVSTTSTLYQSVHYMIVRWSCFCIADVRCLCCSEFLIVCYLIMNWSDLLDCWKSNCQQGSVLTDLTPAHVCVSIYKPDIDFNELLWKHLLCLIYVRKMKT